MGAPSIALSMIDSDRIKLTHKRHSAVIDSTGIDTLTGAVGRNVSRHGSGCDAALLPDRKRLGTKNLEDAASQKMALDVEGVLDGGMDREETLG